MLAKFILICYLTICHSSAVCCILYNWYINFLLSLLCLYQVQCYVMFLLAEFWKYPISLRKHSCQTNRYFLLSFCQFNIYGMDLTHIRIQMWSEFSLFSVVFSLQIAPYTIHLLFILHDNSGFTCFILISRPESGSWTTF